MAGVSITPWFGTVTGGVAGTPQNLQSLIQAKAAADQPTSLNNPSGILRSAQISIMFDPGNSNAKGYITRSDGTTSDFGYYLTAGQVWTPPHMQSNFYRFDQIYLVSDTSSMKWDITFITK